MAQLIVRNLEPQVVARLKARAAAKGHSAEEEHRRILRSALLGEGLLDHLASMPDVGDDTDFSRPPAVDRAVDL